MPTNLDLTHEIRGAIIKALKADPELAAMVPNGYPQTVPAKVEHPFWKMGVPITTPDFIDGGDGSSVSSAVHVFVKKSKTIVDPEVFSMKACAVIVRILNDLTGDLGDGCRLDVFPRQGQTIQDGDVDSFHGFVTFTASAA